jgi:serine protease Do
VREIGGIRIRNIVDAYDALLAARPNGTINVKFTDGTQRKLSPRPIPLPDVIGQAKEVLGLTVAQLTPMLAEKYHLDQQQGVLVTAVDPQSVCGKADVQPGDILVVLWQSRISTLDDLAEVLNRMPQTGRVPIAVIRDNHAARGYLIFGDKI